MDKITAKEVFYARQNPSALADKINSIIEALEAEVEDLKGRVTALEPPQG